jgi:hypothetical protein
MPPVGFESTISAGERPQIYALDRAATETGKLEFTNKKFRPKQTGKAERVHSFSFLQIFI